MTARRRPRLPGVGDGTVRLAALAALAAGVALACSPGAEPQTGPPAAADYTGAPAVVADAAPPNILLVLADDLGFGDVGAYAPGSRIATPTLDALARDGIRLTDAHSPSPVCTPSRYGLLTGREPFRENRVQNSLQPLSPPAIDRERLTLPELLSGAGYTTALVGKWHLGRRYAWKRGRQPVATNIDWTRPMTDGPLQHGFARWFGLARPGWAFLEDGRALSAPDEEYDLGDVPEALYGKRAGRGVRAPGFRFEDVLPRYADWAVSWIEQQAQRPGPFFLMFAPAVPHTPIAPSEPFQGVSGIGPYGDVVVELDDVVGRLLAALERSGQRQDTLVVFTSDNGPETHAYDRLRETDHASMGALRGAKHSLFEGGHRVPFLARWPGRIPAGATSDETISLVDLMATFARVAGAALPDDAAEDSHDVLPALLGESGDAPIRSAAFASRGRRLATRHGDWVLLERGGGGRPEPDWFVEQRGIESARSERALYDLARDPGQTRDAAPDEPERLAALRALQRDALRSRGTRPGRAPQAGEAE